MAKAIDRGMSIESVQADRETRRQIGRMASGDRAEGKAPMSSMITVEEALKRVLASAETPLEEEKVALQAAYGRVLAHDLKALRTQPPFPNSAMDGYALRSADAASAPATLSVGRRIRRGPRLRGRRRSGRGGAHLHRRAHARRRRHDRHSGGREPRGRADPSVSRPCRQGTICVRPAWTFTPATPSSRLAAD